MLNPETEIITEVKRRSPFGWESNRSWDELFGVANKIGHMIAIHTDLRWGGSFDDVTKASELTDKEILAKGIHATDEEVERALDSGADSVLVVMNDGRPLPREQYLDRCLIEPVRLGQLSELPSGLRVVWNRRDLETGAHKAETLMEARALWPDWLCQASFVQSVDQVDGSVDAVLIGTHLVEFAQSLKE